MKDYKKEYVKIMTGGKTAQEMIENAQKNFEKIVQEDKEKTKIKHQSIIDRLNGNK